MAWRTLQNSANFRSKSATKRPTEEIEFVRRHSWTYSAVAVEHGTAHSDIASRLDGTIHDPGLELKSTLTSKVFSPGYRLIEIRRVPPEP